MIRNNKGFTIVELLVSVALLALIMVPVSSFFVNSFKMQSRTSMKTSITRAGQYIIENFKNKNYLDSSENENEILQNNDGTFSEFVNEIELRKNIDGKYDWKDAAVKNVRNWRLNYKGVDYKVDIAIKNFTTSDISNLDIPSKNSCDGEVAINSDGSFGFSSISNGSTFEKDQEFINPIDGKKYKATCPTIVLNSEYATEGNATLWITNDNYYDEESGKQGKIRIIKEFKNELYIYIEGTNLSILKGQEGDGASHEQTRIVSSYVGIPSKGSCDGVVSINSDGSFGFSSISNGNTFEIGQEFINPIDGEKYQATYPTIVLNSEYATEENATLWIMNNNYYNEESDKQKEIRIIKEFEKLYVYIAGTNLSILKEQEEDGAIIRLYVGEEIKNNDKKSSSEILLDAVMTISMVDDGTVSDTFEFSFPVNYDYSKEGE